MSNNEYLARAEHITGNDPDLMAAAEALLAAADETGKFQGLPDEIVREATSGRVNVSDPFTGNPLAGLYSKQMISPGGARRAVRHTVLNLSPFTPPADIPPPEQEPRPETTDQKPIRNDPDKRQAPVRQKTKATRALPALPQNSGVDTRKPVNQNEHTVAIINSKKLSSTAKLAAFVASAELGMKAGRSGKRFADVEHEMSPEWMAPRMGVSEGTARKGMREARQAGFLVRLDDGKGGRKGKRDAARYRASLPGYMEPWGASPRGTDSAP